MSAKQEILLINQQISAIEKSIFDLITKKTQLTKDIKTAESQLSIAEDKLKEYKEQYKYLKSKDTTIVDISVFNETKLAMEYQEDIEQESKSNLFLLKKQLGQIEQLIIDFGLMKEYKLKELNNNYGKIEEFKRRDKNVNSDRS